MKQLILGGARSGKSRYAEHLAEASGLPVCYVATATVRDEAMRARVARHQKDRPTAWTTVEEPVELAGALQAQSAPERFVLVDCLTLWLSNCLEREGAWAVQRDAVLEMLPQLSGPVVFISNEVGQGIVPMGELTRRFVDEAGWLHQALAAVCDKVTFVTAGIPQDLKDVTQ